MKKLLFLLLLLSTPAWATNYCAISQACYLFSENTGTTTADLSGNSNTGTFASSGHPAWISSVPAIPTQSSNIYSTSYANSSDYISIPASSSINNLSALSVSIWAYITSYASTYSLIDKITAAGGWDISAFTAGSADIGFEATFTGDTVYLAHTCSSAVTLNTWTNIVVTWDGSTSASNVHIYKNGTECSYSYSNNGSGSRDSDSAANLIISDSNNYGPVIGNITQVAVFNSVLNSTQISDIYNNGLSPKIIPVITNLYNANIYKATIN